MATTRTIYSVSRDLAGRLSPRLSTPSQIQAAAARNLNWRPGDQTRFTMPDAARYQLKDGVHLVIQQGDITQWEGDAIVNAANEVMLGGGGVDGAIHRAAGPRLVQACKLYPLQEGGRCPTGDARATLAYNLPCQWVIHTVGPVFEKRHARECGQILSQAYRSSLAVANGLGASTVAFPAISCGVYGYPLQAACQTALQACYHFSHDVKEVHFVLFGSDTSDIWISEAEKHFKTAQEESSVNGSEADTGKEQSQEAMQSVDVAASQDQDIDTLTGPKHGADSHSAQAALAAQPVLESTNPAAETDMPGHAEVSTSTQSSADVGSIQPAGVVASDTKPNS